MKKREAKQKSFPPPIKCYLEGSRMVNLLSQQNTPIAWHTRIPQADVSSERDPAQGPSHNEKHESTNTGLGKLQEAASVKAW